MILKLAYQSFLLGHFSISYPDILIGEACTDFKVSLCLPRVHDAVNTLTGKRRLLAVLLLA